MEKRDIGERKTCKEMQSLSGVAREGRGGRQNHPLSAVARTPDEDQVMKHEDRHLLIILDPEPELGDHVRKNIIQAVKEIKYFCIVFDSTPDVSRTDQTSQILRYVKIEGSKAAVVVLY
ncbi:hypothetical protein ILUMI_17253 [Ignelater luminosus]|uniref:Uncharacterized protein n=1 Tax=Ignelater luminosus TaxID=2038154 RepID=A0A8K0CKG1_IGNLU|nr:hypothetical protein ILUMI_17253 [Ignelater luminosus]